MKAQISCKSFFDCELLMRNQDWTDKKNSAVFGEVSSSPSRHTFLVTANVSGDVDEQTGYVVDTKLLHALISKEVLQRFHNKFLNKETIEFANRIPTCENIAYVIYNLLRGKIHHRYHLRISVNEHHNFEATYEG